MSVGTFDDRGGRLSLANDCGVSLTIPEGAFEHGQHEELYIAVCRDLADQPRLNGKFGSLYKMQFVQKIVVLHMTEIF